VSIVAASNEAIVDDANVDLNGRVANKLCTQKHTPHEQQRRIVVQAGEPGARPRRSAFRRMARRPVARPSPTL
jgi:hypothetical protein